jgi:hypothetical protein
MYFVSSMNGEVPYGPEKLPLLICGTQDSNSMDNFSGPNTVWSKKFVNLQSYAIIRNLTQHGIMNTSHNFFKENLAKKSEIEGKQKRKCSPSTLENLNIAILFKK